MKKYLISALLVGVPFLAYANANIIELNEDSTNHFPLRTYKETRISPFQTDETQAIACPAPFNLGNIQQRRDVYKAKDLDGNDQITGYGPWTETSYLVIEQLTNHKIYHVQQIKGVLGHR